MKTTIGLFPDTLFYTIRNQRFAITPLDRPGLHRRDEVLLYIESRNSAIIAALNPGRAAIVVQWLDQDPGTHDFSQVLSLPSSGPCIPLSDNEPNLDLITFVRNSEIELTVSLEHWLAGVRKHHEILLNDKQIARLREWLYRFWTDGLPDVPRRRADESATDFAARRASHSAHPARREGA